LGVQPETMLPRRVNPRGTFRGQRYGAACRISELLSGTGLTIMCGRSRARPTPGPIAQAGPAAGDLERQPRRPGQEPRRSGAHGQGLPGGARHTLAHTLRKCHCPGPFQWVPSRGGSFQKKWNPQERPDVCLAFSTVVLDADSRSMLMLANGIAQPLN